MITYCDECGFEVEIIQNREAAAPVANGEYEPIYEDDYGYFFDVPHLNQFKGECESRLVVTRSEMMM
jgi:hypothetical protein